jgi:hypothetical protein
MFIQGLKGIVLVPGKMHLHAELGEMLLLLGGRVTLTINVRDRSSSELIIWSLLCMWGGTSSMVGWNGRRRAGIDNKANRFALIIDPVGSRLMGRISPCLL